jgi:hypothetical protein
MRLTPLFDTNVFSNASMGLIDQASWRFLRKHRTRKGWPLSAVTAIELLAGLRMVPQDKFGKARDAIALAFDLSSGRVLKEPRQLVCEQLFGREFPEAEIRTKVLSNFLLVASRAREKRELSERKVFIKRHSSRVNTYGGFDPAIVGDLLKGPKEKWVETLGSVLNQVTPLWRERIARGEAYLSPVERMKLRGKAVWTDKRAEFLRAFTEWLSPGLNEQQLLCIDQKMDAVLTLAISILRDVFLRNYAFSKHDSDVYDLFQLHYLALDRYVLVTDDERLAKRLDVSTQRSKVMSFGAFLGTLSHSRTHVAES